MGLCFWGARVSPNRSAGTIIARNYLPQARVLGRSFSEHHAGSRLTALILDDQAGTIGPGEPFDVVRPTDIMGADEFSRMATMYSIVELATAVKPTFLTWLLDRGGSTAVYFDPDIRVFTPLDDVFEAAAEHGVALTPHALEPLPRGGAVTQPEDVILDVGIFNLGFVAVGPSGVPALAWWADRLARECVIDPTRGRFVDQRWVDLFMGYFNPAVLRDAGMNVAWWNLATRDVTESGRDYLVDGVPLRFFHFSGYDPRTPWLVSRHQGPLPRVTMTERPALQRITGEYAAALAEEGFDEWSCVPYGLDTTPGGLILDPLMRNLYGDALRRAEAADSDDPPNPFIDGDGPFIRWLAAPDPGASGPRPASRYVHALWTGSTELRAAYPDPHGADSGRLLEWALSGGIPHAVAGAVPAPIEPPPPRSFQIGLHVVGMLHADRVDAEIGRRIARSALALGLPVEVSAIERLAGPGAVPLPDGVRAGNLTLNVIVMPVGRIAEANHIIGDAKREGRRTAAVLIGDGARTLVVPPEAAGIIDEAWFLSADALSGVEGLRPGTVTRVLPIVPDPLPNAGTAKDEALVVSVIDAAESIRPDIDLTLAAFAAVREHRPNARLVIAVIHADHDGQLRERLAYVAAITPTVDFCDVTIGEARALVGAAGMLIWLPPSADAAVWVVDAVCGGTPVLATACGQVREIGDSPFLAAIDVHDDMSAQVARKLQRMAHSDSRATTSIRSNLGDFLRDRAAQPAPRRSRRSLGWRRHGRAAA